MFFFALIHEVGPDRALVFTYLNPAVAVTAGVLFLGEPLSPTLIGAFVLVLSGSILATSRGKPHQATDEQFGGVGTLRQTIETRTAGQQPQVKNLATGDR